MANEILVKRLLVTGHKPYANQLNYGELAFNTMDGNLFSVVNIAGSKTVKKINATTPGDVGLSNVKNIDTSQSDNIENNSTKVVGDNVTEALDTLCEEFESIEEALAAGHLISGYAEKTVGKFHATGNTVYFNTDEEEIVFYMNAKKYIMDTTLSITLSGDGGRYICYDPELNELYDLPGWPDYFTHMLTLWAYVSNGNVIWLGRETHGASRNLEWHRNQHANLGTVWRRGGNISIDSSNKITISTPITIADEDLSHVIIHSNSPSSEYEQNLNNVDLPTMWYDGNKWLYGSDGLSLNYYNSGSLSSIPIGKFATFFVMFTNDYINPVKLLLPDEYFDTKQEAMDDDFDDAGLPMPEVVPAYKIVVQNDGGSLLVDSTFRITSREMGVSQMSYTIKSHDELFDKDLEDQHPISSITGLQTALNGKSPTSHTHSLASLGIGNINNTSDADKPVSIAQQAALNLKIDKDSITQTLNGYSETLVTSQKAVKEGADQLWEDCVKLDTYQPEGTVSAKFQRSSNTITVSLHNNLMEDYRLELGDVIQITGSSQSANNQMFTIEALGVDGNGDSTIVVNYEHRDGNGELSLADVGSFQNVTLKRVAKWWYAPDGLGQKWVKVSKSRNTTYTASFNRSISFFIRYVFGLTVSSVTLTLDGKEMTTRGEMFQRVGPGGTYRFSNVTDFWELR